MEKEFSYFFDWQNYKENNLMERAVAEFAANGAFCPILKRLNFVTITILPNPT